MPNISHIIYLIKLTVKIAIWERKRKGLPLLLAYEKKYFEILCFQYHLKNKQKIRTGFEKGASSTENIPK